MTTTPGADPAAPPARVLIVRLGAVGDVVRTLPAVRLLRRAWPQARFAWAVEAGPAPLLTGHPDLDTVLVLDRRTLASPGAWFLLKAPAVLGRFLSSLRGFRPDLSLDFQSSLKSALVARLSGAPRRLGFDRPFDREKSHLLATERVGLPAGPLSRVERAVRLARAAGAPEGPIQADLAQSAEELARARRRVLDLLPRGPRIALAPFSSPRQRWKRYPLEGWAEAARGLCAAGCGVLILAGPGEEAEARLLAARAGGGPLLLPPLGLRDLAALLGCVDLYLGGDTGPMHLAWAAGTPVVAVYGPTDPVVNAPWGEGHVALHPERVSRRRDAERFAGITPRLIVECTLERLALLNNSTWEISKA